MNYKKIYKSLMEKVKSEDRIKGAEYFEKHHIIPDFMFRERKRSGPKGHLSGNPNHPKNLVLLRPREHLLAHILLYKILKGTHYEYPAGSSLSFFIIKHNEFIEDPNHPRLRDFAGYGRKYEKIKLLGNRNISKMNIGWMSVRNATTGKYFGRMHKNDDRLKSGEYVHHSKGRHKYRNKETGEEIWARTNDIDRNLYEGVTNDQKGKNNSNYKEMTNDRKIRLFDLFDHCVEENHLKLSSLICLMKEEFVEFKKISRVWIINNFGSIQNMVAEYNIVRNKNICYNSYYKFASSKSKIAETLRNKNA